VKFFLFSCHNDFLSSDLKKRMAGATEMQARECGIPLIHRVTICGRKTKFLTIWHCQRRSGDKWSGSRTRTTMLWVQILSETSQFPSVPQWNA
jgi:hypothetical protein